MRGPRRAGPRGGWLPRAISPTACCLGCPPWPTPSSNGRHLLGTARRHPEPATWGSGARRALTAMSPTRSVLHDGELSVPTFDAGPGSLCQLLVGEQLREVLGASVPASRPEGGPHGNLGSV